MDLFFSDSLYNTKVFIVSIILTIIFFILLLTRKIYKKKLTFTNLSIYSSLFLLFIAFASLFVVNFFGKFTYVLFIAATITIIYSEISFLLGKYFFPNFVSENVSKEIVYMFSFIVFINAMLVPEARTFNMFFYSVNTQVEGQCNFNNNFAIETPIVYISNIAPGSI